MFAETAEKNNFKKFDEQFSEYLKLDAIFEDSNAFRIRQCVSKLDHQDKQESLNNKNEISIIKDKKDEESKLMVGDLGSHNRLSRMGESMVTFPPSSPISSTSTSLTPITPLTENSSATSKLFINSNSNSTVANTPRTASSMVYITTLFEQLKDFPFFFDIDWNRLEEGKEEPPFVPSKEANIEVNSADLVGGLGFQDDDGKEENIKKIENLYVSETYQAKFRGMEYNTAL